MGVLLFGTPIFLLFGYSFVEVLVLLLPISMMISFATVVSAGRGRWRALHVCLLVFPIMVGTVLAMDRDTEVLVLLVGLAMAVTATMNYLFRDRVVAERTLIDAVSIPVIGVIHGLTNQGGGLLLMWAGSVGTSASDIRSTVAFFYGIMASIQLMTAAYLHPEVFKSEFEVMNLLLPVGAFVLGAFIFSGIPKDRFKIAVNYAVFVFGIFVFLRGVMGVSFGS